jgi:PAS domain S-box-containing protein
METVVWSKGLSSRLIELIKTGIILTDGKGRIRFVNNQAAKMLGYPKSDLAGTSLEGLFPPDDRTILVPNIMKLTRENSGFEGEVLLHKQDGSHLFVKLSTARYSGNAPRYELIILTLQDVTRLKKIEKEALGSERFAGLGRITDQISHQIRNPIVSIGGFALRLAKEQVSKDDYANYSKIIHSEAKRLEYIIDRLAEFTRIHPVQYNRLTLSDVFEKARGVFVSSAQETPLRIKFPDIKMLPVTPLFGDLDALVRAIQCIIQNSLEAISMKGEVNIDGDIEDNLVLIKVRDNGEGILPEHLAFVFDPFFTTRFNYLGLGLTMAKRIIQEHKGSIEVSSVEGGGTEVQVTLPRERRREIRTKRL